MSNLFSKRNNPVKHEIYKFDELPSQLRVQILYIWGTSLGDSDPYRNRAAEQVYDEMYNIMCREHGLLRLVDGIGSSSYEQCVYFLLEEEEVLKVLDLIELSMIAVGNIHREEHPGYLKAIGATQSPKDAIEELNKRFKEHGVGYQFLGNQLFKKDSEYIYQEATKQALTLLNEEEFLNAHTLYKEGKNKEAMTEALKSFESTMKTICKRKNWAVGNKETAAPLIRTLFDNGLVPNHFQTQINALKTTLEGLATLRNKHSGHGQGEVSVEVPNYLAQYSLNLCGTNILFLISAYKEVK